MVPSRRGRPARDRRRAPTAAGDGSPARPTAAGDGSPARRAWARVGPAAWAVAMVVVAAAVMVGGAGSGRVAASALTLLTTTTKPAATTTTTVAATTTTTVAPTTTTTVAPTTTTSAPPGSGGSGSGGSGSGGSGSGTPELDAAMVPCSPARAGPCTADPSVLEVTYAAKVTVTAVDVVWDPGPGRPSAAPQPAKPSVLLGAQSTKSCPTRPSDPSGEVTLCWAWPSGLTYTATRSSRTWILNGTYRVTACSGSTPTTPCEPQRAYSPDPIGLAVAPAPPRDVGATSSGSVVTITWSPSAVPEPDLVGYSVLRDGTPVYSCSVPAGWPVAGSACSTPLYDKDSPGQGRWTYSVEALRFGTASSLQDAVPSGAPPAAPVSAAGVQFAGPTPVGLSVVPVAGSAPTLPSVLPPSSAAGTYSPAPAATTAVGSDNPAISGLPYSASKSTAAAAPVSVSGTKETGPAAPGRDSLASVALGLIALALAAHAWYLRGEAAAAVARRQARASAARSGAAPG
jgi:hypothetical protein